MGEHLIPGKCPACFGERDDCEQCCGVGTVAFTMPDIATGWTRECPDCGWQNGAYFPQPGKKVPVDGEPLGDAAFGNCCLPCGRGGHMIWRKF